MKRIWQILTSPIIEQMSGGLITRFTREQAAGMMANWMAESGPNFSNLDVVEKGNNQAGRGLSQYTGVRRTAYDSFRKQALAAGKNLNDATTQIQYFVDEYLGKYDKLAGGSLSGWSKAFENRPQDKSAAEYTEYFMDSYFRPGTPHFDKRVMYSGELMLMANELGSTDSTPSHYPGTPMSHPNPTAAQRKRASKHNNDQISDDNIAKNSARIKTNGMTIASQSKFPGNRRGAGTR